MSIHSPRSFRNDDAPTCTLPWICKQLGHEGSEACAVAYVEGLIATHGFPRPLPHRAHGGRILDSVHYTRSRWVRAGVVVWLGDYLPPAAGAALTAQAEAAAAAEMDRAATGLALHLVGGTAA